MSAKPNGRPSYYIDLSDSACGEGGCSYLQVQTYFHLLNIFVDTSLNTITINFEAGVNVSGTATGQNRSFDNTLSYLNIYLNNSLTPAIMNPPINIPVGADNYYSLTTSTSYVGNLTSIKFDGYIYGKGSGGGTEANPSTQIPNIVFDMRVISSQISIISSNPTQQAFIILPTPIQGQLFFIKNIRNVNVYVSTNYFLDNYTDGTITLGTNCCLGVVSDGAGWWIVSWYGNDFGNNTGVLPPFFRFFFGASSSASGTITQPITYRVVSNSQANIVGYDLPNPATFDSTILVVIQQGVELVLNKYICLNSTTNQYLYDDTTNQGGLYFRTSGYGSNIGRGNASVVLISDKVKWYIACVQASEYINYDTTIGTFTQMPVSISLTNSIDASFNPISILDLSEGVGQIFFMKKKIDDGLNGPYIVLPNSTNQLIGGKNDSSTNYTRAWAVNESAGTAYEAYIMLGMKQGANTVYYFLGYYPWST